MLHWTSLSYPLVLQTVVVCGWFYSTEASSADAGVPLERTPRCEGGPAYGKRMLKAFIREHLEFKNTFGVETSSTVDGFIPRAVCFTSEKPFMSCDLFLT